MLARLDDLAERFEEVARLLDELGLDELWDAADDERRVLSTREVGAWQAWLDAA